MAREREIFLDQPLRGGMHGNKSDFVALALDPKMHHALTALQVLHAQPAQLLAAQAVIEQGSQDGAIAFAFERVVWRRFEQLARLRIAERRRCSTSCTCSLGPRSASRSKAAVSSLSLGNVGGIP